MFTALVCIQPKIASTGAAGSNRYWYNSITGGCEPFLFDPLTGNSNAFLTPEFCLSYCGAGKIIFHDKILFISFAFIAACDHGPPLLTAASTTALNRARTCTTAADCISTVTGQTYTCTATGPTSTCCASSSTK